MPPRHEFITINGAFAVPVDLPEAFTPVFGRDLRAEIPQEPGEFREITALIAVCAALVELCSEIGRVIA